MGLYKGYLGLYKDNVKKHGSYHLGFRLLHRGHVGYSQNYGPLSSINYITVCVVEMSEKPIGT